MWLKRALSYYMEGEHEECKGLLGCLTGGVHLGGLCRWCLGVRATVRRAGS